MKMQGTSLKGHGVGYEINEHPSECPICHTSISPIFKFAIETLPDGQKLRLQAAYQCTGPLCKRLFIASYSAVRGQTFQLGKTAPLSPVKHGFPPEIEEISPTFIKIFNQVAAAESSELDQLVGIGLRKALEFLIKDYAILQKPDEEKNIKKKFLSKCIKEYIDDPNVKQCAQFASWLGNDEAHYIRTWKEQDINDLKTLIKLTVNWIHSTLLTEKYASVMGGTSTKKPDEKTTKQ